jgi:hypothetical protein
MLGNNGYGVGVTVVVLRVTVVVFESTGRGGGE